MIALAVACAAVSFLLSSAAGMGGSLILVPVMGLALGPREGVAAATLLLAANNVGKVAVYRAFVPWRAALGLVVLTSAGAALGAVLLLRVPESWVQAAIVVALLASFTAERRRWGRRASSPLLAFAAGASSGFSGTSGPLKGVALRNLGLQRMWMVGAASAVSLAGDLTKLGVFAGGGLLSPQALRIVLFAAPLVPLAALAGRRLNGALGERAFAALFWTVMTGYSLRLLAV
ncbi:MAG TPA: sulfite exporter TauE/SafE family protein [Longimicrobium sp.]|nr:sulfite exporter TauE/SafE family protein [Longimicrobium sp.]